MGGLSSLFQGTAPPGVNSYNQSVSSVPSWMLNSANSAIAQANAVAGQPYQAFPGPQVAPWSPMQNQAASEVQGLQTAYQPYLNSAMTTATNAANPSAFASAYGYLPGAASAINNAVPGAMGALSSAYGYIPQAAGAINSALAPTSAQMSPYLNNVIQNAQTQATQYWQDQLQPSINNQFTAAGQFGSSADLQANNFAANQLAENINSQGLAALNQGYIQAQNAGLQGASQLGALGQLQGNLAATQAGLGLQQGQALGTLSQLQGGLGYEQGILGLQGAGQMGTLAQLGQGLGLQGAGTLYNLGAQQQQLGQQNLNAAYNNWYNQTYYPQSQLSWLSGLMSGTASPYTTGAATSGTTAGYLPGAQYGAAPVNQATSMYSGLSGLG